MKKILVLALAIVMALSVVALVACAEPQTVEGEYKYENPWTAGNYYGVKVSVTVQGNRISKVEITSTDDPDDKYTNLSSGWTDEGKKTWNDGKADFLTSFEGLTVDEVKAIKVEKDANGAPNTAKDVDTIKDAPASLKIVETAEHTGATQSSGRVILAVQDALSKLAK